MLETDGMGLACIEIALGFPALDLPSIQWSLASKALPPPASPPPCSGRGRVSGGGGRGEEVRGAGEAGWKSKEQNGGGFRHPMVSLPPPPT